MFGIYRLLLCVTVLLTHLLNTPYIGRYGVFGFYILSGVLMTFVVQRNYGYSPAGIMRYTANRFLRIFPSYWVSILISILLILLLGDEFTRKFHRAMFIPDNWVSWTRNIFLLFEHNYRPRLTPVAWALTVEFFFYLAIGFGLSKSRVITLVWLFVSILYHAVGAYMGLSSGDRYFPIYAASLPVAIGATIYHYRDKLVQLTKVKNPTLDAYLPLLCLVVFVTHWAIGTQIGTNYDYLRDTGFYVSIVLSAIMVVLLLDRPFLPGIDRAVDSRIGDTTYGIYLIHLQAGLVAFAIIRFFGLDYGKQSWPILLIGTPIAFLTAWLITVGVGYPADRIREIVKKIGVSSGEQPG